MHVRVPKPKPGWGQQLRLRPLHLAGLRCACCAPRPSKDWWAKPKAAGRSMAADAKGIHHPAAAGAGNANDCGASCLITMPASCRNLELRAGLWHTSDSGTNLYTESSINTTPLLTRQLQVQVQHCFRNLKLGVGLVPQTNHAAVP